MHEKFSNVRTNPYHNTYLINLYKSSYSIMVTKGIGFKQQFQLLPIVNINHTDEIKRTFDKTCKIVYINIKNNIYFYKHNLKIAIISKIYYKKAYFF